MCGVRVLFRDKSNEVLAKNRIVSVEEVRAGNPDIILGCWCGKKVNFNSIRKGQIIGEHAVKFSSGKEIIKLNHESFDRALYSEGALTAAMWLMNKKPGLYSMRDLLNFK